MDSKISDGGERQRGKGESFGVQKQIGGNTVSVVDNVLKALPQIQKELPKGVSLQVVSDQSTFIRKSIKYLQHEAMIGAFLAVTIILIFLGSGTSTLIIAHSIPISIITTFVLPPFRQVHTEHHDPGRFGPGRWPTGRRRDCRS
jgi:multidrug efflux pump subunit AcrB